MGRRKPSHSETFSADTCATTSAERVFLEGLGRCAPFFGYLTLIRANRRVKGTRVFLPVTAAETSRPNCSRGWQTNSPLPTHHTGPPRNLNSSMRQQHSTNSAIGQHLWRTKQVAKMDGLKTDLQQRVTAYVCMCAVQRFIVLTKNKQKQIMFAQKV